MWEAAARTGGREGGRGDVVVCAWFEGCRGGTIGLGAEKVWASHENGGTYKF